MKGYEFTERGRIIIVVLVIALLVLPAAVVSVRAFSNLPVDDDPGQYIADSGPADPEATEPPSDDTEDLPDSDSTLDPCKIPPQDEDGEQGSFDPPIEPPLSPDHTDEDEPVDEDIYIGPVDINVPAGTMSFAFSPELQDTVDTETISMIGDFLRSPGNTRNSIIVVHIPDLSGTEKDILVNAVVEAFAQHGVARDDLSYVTYSPVAVDMPHIISLSYERVTDQKETK